MPKLSDISKRREQNPQIKAAELQGRTFSLLDCAGPYEAKKTGKYENKPFLVFVVALDDLTPEETDAGGIFDLLLTHTAGQRDDLLTYFTDPDNTAEPVGPLTMEPLDVGQPKPMWAFVDVEPVTDPTPAGKGSSKK